MPKSKYLIPVEFSDPDRRALDYGARLARGHRGASLVLFHVITESAQNVPFYLRQKYYAELEQSARERMARMSRRKSLERVRVSAAVVRARDAAAAIARKAKTSRVTMIVMGSHSRTGLKRLMFGSVAERIVAAAPCPVLIVK